MNKQNLESQFVQLLLNDKNMFIIDRVYSDL